MARPSLAIFGHQNLCRYSALVELFLLDRSYLLNALTVVFVRTRGTFADRTGDQILDQGFLHMTAVREVFARARAVSNRLPLSFFFLVLESSDVGENFRVRPSAIVSPEELSNGTRHSSCQRKDTRIDPVSPHGLFCATACGTTVYMGLIWFLVYSISGTTRLSITLGGLGGPKSARVLLMVSYFRPADGGSLIIELFNILLR